MRFSSSLSTDQILATFTDEIVAHGGRVTDTYNDGSRLWTRSLLARTDHVAPGDQVQGGVALKANESEVRVYPYVFRQVCSNGAIIAETIGSRAVSDLEFKEPELAIEAIREAVEACCAAEAFRGNVQRMHDAKADQAISILPLLGRLLSPGANKFVGRIIEEFIAEGDRTRFGLANAVTAVARDTKDPEMRWNLEELGGGIAVGIMPASPVDHGHAARELAGELVEVG